MNTEDFKDDQLRTMGLELEDAYRQIERLECRVTELEGLLREPAVAAVVALVEEARHQFNRAEAAHEAKDEANRRWLKLASRD